MARDGRTGADSPFWNCLGPGSCHECDLEKLVFRCSNPEAQHWRNPTPGLSPGPCGHRGTASSTELFSSTVPAWAAPFLPVSREPSHPVVGRFLAAPGFQLQRSNVVLALCPPPKLTASVEAFWKPDGLFGGNTVTGVERAKDERHPATHKTVPCCLMSCTTSEHLEIHTGKTVYHYLAIKPTSIDIKTQNHSGTVKYTLFIKICLQF